MVAFVSQYMPELSVAGSLGALISAYVFLLVNLRNDFLDETGDDE